METKKAISLTLDKNNIDFIEIQSANKQKSKSEIIDNILNSYQRYCLKKEIITGFKSQTKEDTREAMLDFDGYLELIDQSDEN